MARKVLILLKHPEAVFALLALVLGTAFVFLLPTGAGFDEMAHLARAIEISTGEFIPNRTLSQQPLVPLVINEVTYRSRVFYTPVEKDFFARYKDRKIDWTLVFPKDTYSVYFPILYLPQTAVIWLARRLDWSVLGLYYACRLAEVIGYTILGFFAVRQIPFGKWVLALLALAPIAIQQAASISTDPYSNGAAFLFVGWVLHLAFQEKHYTRGQVLLTLLTLLLLFSAKVNAAVLAVLLILLPKRKFPGPRSYYLFLAAATVLFLVVVVAWNGYISLDFRVERADRGIWKQAAYILGDPLGFIRLFFNDIFKNALTYAQQWIAVNPNFITPVPPIVYLLYAGFLALTILTDTSTRAVPSRVRWTLIAAFVLSYTASVVFLYLGGRGPGDEINLNGRYLTLAAPPLILALLPSRPLPLLRKIPFVACTPGIFTTAGALTAVPAFMVGIYLTFYVSCGTTAYVPGLCQLPNYKNLDPTTTFTPPVTRERPVVQEFLAECDRFESISVWANPPQASPYSSTTYTVRDLENGNLAAQTSLPNRQANFDDWFEIPISPVDHAAGRRYAIEITSDNPDETTSLVFSTSANDEYTSGRLFIQGTEEKRDLYFHYGCSSGK